MSPSSDPPILRIWHGRTPRAHADAYADFLLERAVPDYRSVPGNLDVRVARRDEGEITHFLTVTRWANATAIRTFAGDDLLAAKYYPEDAEFLLEFEPTVTHYELVESPPLPPLTLRQPGNGIKLLGLCGSLRRASTNRALLTAGARLASGMANQVPVRIELFERLGELPPFVPEPGLALPEAVVALADAVRAADGLIVSSPEYARGVPGALKNALDWLVGGDAFIAKPFALWSASPRAARAQEALAETLGTMSGLYVARASVTLSLLGRSVGAEDLIADEATAEALYAALAAYSAAFSAS